MIGTGSCANVFTAFGNSYIAANIPRSTYLILDQAISWFSRSRRRESLNSYLIDPSVTVSKHSDPMAWRGNAMPVRYFLENHSSDSTAERRSNYPFLNRRQFYANCFFPVSAKSVEIGGKRSHSIHAGAVEQANAK